MQAIPMQVEVRERRRWLTLALMRLLLLVDWALPTPTLERLANGVLGMYRLECRIGDGPWQRIYHDMTAESLTAGR